MVAIPNCAQLKVQGEMARCVESPPEELLPWSNTFVEVTHRTPKTYQAMMSKAFECEAFVCVPPVMGMVTDGGLFIRTFVEDGGEEGGLSKNPQESGGWGGRRRVPAVSTCKVDIKK